MARTKTLRNDSPATIVTRRASKIGTPSTFFCVALASGSGADSRPKVVTT